MKKKVVVGMSGGVDSSVAAYILKEQGYEVIGVTMQIWQNDSQEQADGCCGLSAVDDARRVASKLDIPYYVLNFKEVFKKKVIDYFIDEYMVGRTPNPCIACNRYVKWESLLKKALEIGADYIATGHYSKIVRHPDTGRYTLLRTESNGKDQTYALYNLQQFQLEHTLMPLGGYTKDKVRDIAKDIGLYIADKPDSQEICFVPDNDYGRFIESQNIAGKGAGEFVDVDDKVLGIHRGIAHYTIGQRKGLGISFGKPMYVKKLDVKRNRIVLADNKDLFSKELLADKISFMSMDDLEDLAKVKNVKGQIRYAHKPAECKVYVEDQKLKCEFKEPQRAITPGQAVVFYDDDYVLGGGVILQSGEEHIV